MAVRLDFDDFELSGRSERHRNIDFFQYIFDVEYGCESRKVN